VQRGDLHQLVRLPNRPPGVRQKRGAGVGQIDAAGVAAEELHAELALERLDRERQRRL